MATKLPVLQDSMGGPVETLAGTVAEGRARAYRGNTEEFSVARAGQEPRHFQVRKRLKLKEAGNHAFPAPC